MRFAFFVHSLVSCWNHGNAHFLRGVVRALQNKGHHVVVYEPDNGWSLRSLLADQGEAGLTAFCKTYPDLHTRTYTRNDDFSVLLQSVDVVIAHEWNEQWVLQAIAYIRRQSDFLFFFHDTHHRAISDMQSLLGSWINNCDAVLAFGASLAEVYLRQSWHDRVFVWHEAADTSVFKPPVLDPVRQGLVFIGNWGDNERNTTLVQYLLRPTQAAKLPLDIFGVRYPPSARGTLAAHGAHYRGFLANVDVPINFSRYRATVHVPRSFYVKHLPGIPTIRVFEALACGIPLLSAPWDDSEKLFDPESFLVARNSVEMEQIMQAICHDDLLWQTLSTKGVAQIQAKHSCDIRAHELLNHIRTFQSKQSRVA